MSLRASAIMFKFDDKLCAECGGFTMFSTIKNEENMKWILKDGGCSVDAVEKAGCSTKAGIFTMIAKISLGLRKFR